MSFNIQQFQSKSKAESDPLKVSPNNFNEFQISGEDEELKNLFTITEDGLLYTKVTFGIITSFWAQNVQ